MVCMVMIMYMVCAFGFLLFVHPLWLSLVVFVSSVMISLFKFYATFYSDMYPYLFVMVYSGGLLLLLVYMSSLVPNNNLILWGFVFNVFFLCTLGVVFMYMFNDSNTFVMNKDIGDDFVSLGMSYFLNHKEITNSLIIFLLFAFCLISYMMSLLKYPVRSL
uniref:NADH dehydrogenase subunit 6 n=1 Tax=Trichuris sp. ETH392 TaxID=2856029 RepID=A0A8F5HWV4_9BILA|nr:NADH dehydrogenase subunit 6 [Trichuris sp. ETH392]